MKKIVFEGEEFIISHDKAVYGGICVFFRNSAEKIERELNIKYNQEGNIGNVISLFPKLVSKMQELIFEEALKILEKYNINISVEDFMETYAERFRYEKYIEDKLDKYSQIIGKKELLAAYRKIQSNAPRGRWQGGGFGITGALKGAVMASALNWGNDMLHDLGNFAKESSDNASIKKQLEKLYRDKETKSEFAHGAYQCIMAVCDALYEVMERKGILESGTCDQEAAEKLFVEGKSEGNKSKILQSLLLNPFDVEQYKKTLKVCVKIMRNTTEAVETNSLIVQQVVDEYEKELKKFLEEVAANCLVWEIVDWIINEKINDDMLIKIRRDKLFNIANNAYVTKGGYMNLKEQYQKLTLEFDRNLPDSNPYTKKLRDYFAMAESEYPGIETDSEELFAYYDVYKDKELSIEDFVKRIFEELKRKRPDLYDSSVSGISLDIKAKERIIKNMYDIEGLGKLLLVHDDSNKKNLISRGFALFENAVICFKAKKIINIQDIDKCICDYDDCSIIVDGNTDHIRGNSRILSYLEVILNAYGKFKGSYKRKEEEKRLEEEERQRQIDQLSGEGFKKCLENGIQYMIQGDVVTANRYFAAVGTENRECLSLSSLGNACLFLDKWQDKGEFDLSVRRAIRQAPQKFTEYYTQMLQKLVDYKTEYENNFLMKIMIDEKYEQLEFFLQFNIDVSKVSKDNKTLLDYLESNNYIRMEDEEDQILKEERYKKIKDVIIKRGGKRKWNLRFDIPYCDYETAYDYACDFIIFHFKKSTRSLKVGRNVRTEEPEKYQKAVENLGVQNGEDVCFIFDNTLLGGMKTGFALAESGVYLVSDEDEHLFINWENFVKVELGREGNYFYIEGAKLLDTSGNLWPLVVLQKELPEIAQDKTDFLKQKKTKKDLSKTPLMHEDNEKKINMNDREQGDFSNKENFYDKVEEIRKDVKQKIATSLAGTGISVFFFLILDSLILKLVFIGICAYLWRQTIIKKMELEELTGNKESILECLANDMTDKDFKEKNFSNSDKGKSSLNESKEETKQESQEKCPICGNVIHKDDKFCRKCGKKLKDNDEK